MWNACKWNGKHILNVLRRHPWRKADNLCNEQGIYFDANIPEIANILTAQTIFSSKDVALYEW